MGEEIGLFTETEANNIDRSRRIAIRQNELIEKPLEDIKEIVNDDTILKEIKKCNRNQLAIKKELKEINNKLDKLLEEK